MKDEILKLEDKDGNVKDFIVLLVFKWYRTNKYYIVYADKDNDLNNNYEVYANIFDPHDLSALKEIETEEEWDEIKYRLGEMRSRNV